MTKPILVGCLAIMSVGIVSGQVVGPRGKRSPLSALSATAERALLDQHCVGCHNKRVKSAGLALDDLDVGAGRSPRRDVGASWCGKFGPA